MTLHLDDKWVWDFWFAQDGADTHIFYLQAPRTLREERLRHWHVTIGHAVSQDLRHWEVLPDALHPNSDPHAFDGYTTWTGSIIWHEGLWYMFYTGSRDAERGLVQRIGLATSSDLMTWERHPENPLIEADPTWYELYDGTAWHDQAWRDPYVFQHPDTGLFHIFLTARVKEGLVDARGVIGHAFSTDLIHWEVTEPVTQPGEFGHLEVPQLLCIQDRYYILFSCPHRFCSMNRKNRLTDGLVTGTHYLAADDPLGPYDSLTDTFLVGDYIGTLYSGRAVQDARGQWQFMAFKNFSPDGQFVGDISDPMPLLVEADGRLRVVRNGETP